MRTADGGAESAVVDTRRMHWRGALIGVGVVFAGGLLALLAPQPVHAATADDPRPGSGLGTFLGGLTGLVDDITSPIIDPLPDARDLPVVGDLVGQVADSKPVSTLTEPVSGLVDGLLGSTVESVPVVGDLLGDEPVAGILDPVGDAVDDVLGDVAGTPPVVAPDPEPAPGPHNPGVPDSEGPGSEPEEPGADGDVPDASEPVTSGTDDPDASVTLAAETASDASGFAVPAGAVHASGDPMISRVEGSATSIAVGAEGPIKGPVSVPGDLPPSSAVTAGVSPFGLTAAVLGVGLLLMLASGFIRRASVRIPPSPTYGTDTSPD